MVLWWATFKSLNPTTALASIPCAAVFSLRPRIETGPTPYRIYILGCVRGSGAHSTLRSAPATGSSQTRRRLLLSHQRCHLLRNKLP